MRGYRFSLGMATLGILLCATPFAAQETQDKADSNAPHWYSPSKYNPVKWIKRDTRSANDQLASDGRLEEKLSKQLRLQGILQEGKELQDACSDFKHLPECIAVLRLTKSLQVEFTCLKWNVTGVKPISVADSCAGPAGGKAMPLDRALDLLKPNADVKTEAHNALKKAQDDIKDASS